MKFLATLLAVLFLAAPSFADDQNCSIVAVAINPTEAGGTDDWINLVDSSFDASNAAADAFVMPYEGVISQLTARVATAPGTNDTYDIYVSVDGTTAATSILSVEILGTAVVHTPQTSSDVKAVTVARGADVTILVDTADGTGDPAANAELSVSFCITKS